MSQATRMLPASAAGWAGLAAGAVVLALVPLFASPYHVELGTTAMIAALFALSMHLLTGATGLVSLGHAAFYGLAAYVVFLLSPEGAPRPLWLTLPAAMLAAAVAALVIGAVSLRTKGFFFLMVTLAFGQMVFFIFHDTKLGGGTDGAYLAKPLISAFGMTLELPRRQRALGPYYVALAQLVATYLGLAWLLRSLFGRVLEGIRVNEHRMQAIGYDTYRYKLAAFVIAGTLAGAAGHMWALHSGFVNPELNGWHKSAEALLMILLGGIGSLAGAIVGAFAYTGLGELPQILADTKPFARFFGMLGMERIGVSLQALAERKILLEGLVILAVVLVLPRGITGIGMRRPEPAAAGDDGAMPETDAAARPATETRHG